MKMNTCSGCGGPVPARRKSTSGDHWCKQPQCQSKRQMAWRRARAEESRDDEGLTLTEARFRLFVDALDPTKRDKCHACGLENALVGYAHRDGQGGACLTLGRRGNRVGTAWVDAVHPERAPR